jgi:drug/metabolite transporter (DMT)-like permease
MWGLARTDASAASLLLALEGAATALIAWFIFHEGFDHRILIGFACLVGGAIILSWSGTPTLPTVESWGPVSSGVSTTT